MSGKRVFAASLVLILLATSWATLAAHTPPAHADTVGPSDSPVIQSTKSGHGFLRVAVLDDLKTTNAVIAQDCWDWLVLDRIIDPFIEKDPETGSTIPWMAESWTGVPGDGRNGTMTLRKGMFWTDHDFDAYGEEVLYDGSGEPGHFAMGPTDYGETPGYSEVTAYDVVFSLNLFLNRDFCVVDPYHISSWFLEYDDQYAAVDRYTVQFNLTEPVFDFPLPLFRYPVLPMHIWESHVDEKLTWQPEVSEVVFSGMFILDTWQKGSYVRLVTNQHYWNKSAIPNIDGIIFRVYLNTDLALTALWNDDIDLIPWSILPGYIPAIVEDPDLGLAQTPEFGSYYYSYNMRNPAFGYDEYDSPARVDVGKPLRVAIAHCVNKQKIILQLLNGKGTVGDSVISPADKVFYNSTVVTYPYDPEVARQVLEDAGYYRVSGWYVSPDGSPIDGPGGDGVIEILHPSADYDPVRAEAARMLADQLNAIGIKAEDKAAPWGLPADFLEHYEIVFFEPYIESDAVDYLVDRFHSEIGVGTENYAGYRNSSYDTVVERLESAADLEEAVWLSKWAQGIISRDLPVNVLYYRDVLEAYRTSNFVYGWHPMIGGLLNRWTLIDLSKVNAPPMAVAIDGPGKLNANATYVVTVSDAITCERIPGANVSLTALYGKGLVTPDFALTDARGRANFTFSPMDLETWAVETLKAVASYNLTEKVAVKQVTLTVPGTFWLDVDAEVLVPMPVEYGDAMDFGVSFEITVADSDGSWLEGATVNVTADEGILSDYNLTTDATGTASFTFTPSANQTDNVVYVVSAMATYWRETDSSTYVDSVDIPIEVLYFKKAMSVDVRVDNPSPRIGEEVTVTVTVRDTYLTPIAGAVVTLTSDPEMEMATPNSATTNHLGIATFTVTPEGYVPYKVTAHVEKDLYLNGTGFEWIVVEEHHPPPPCGGGLPFIPVVALVALAAIRISRRRKSQ